MKLQGAVALVTGAACGLGRGFADALLSAGARVCLADCDTELGKATTTELQEQYGENNAIFCKCNIVSVEEFEEAFKKTNKAFGGLDIVVNNAGIGGETDGKWENVVDVNMKGTLRGLRLGMKYLSTENGGKGGAIINIGSMAGVNPNPFSPVYGCTKAGIIHATRCYVMSEEAKNSGIRLNVLCPAFVDTPMLRNLSDGDRTQSVGWAQSKVKAFIAQIGVLKNLFPVLRQPKVFKDLIDVMVEKCAGVNIIVGLESRGFLFGPLIAQALNVAFVPVRKKGKLPGETIKVEYTLEYGRDVFELQQNSVQPGQKVVVVDDLLATGGTMKAACELMEAVKAEVLACQVIIELVDLKGRQKLNYPLLSYIR